ncbi:hypothetical protein PY365_17130 [Roseiarcaceae bacterium H3SJ34-1]|jgi:hypothetical protein|uniref:hypothetical protein n=1 Tax=Hyphomicrobiales TaxID=356 RepID=UPI00070F2F54|nr:MULTISPECIES: hypothetical protein [unclassified Bradyrhizobium]KQT22719.1 hypothetical protein ASG57_25900 [Bradyrhizobium sp. Leaf396]MDF2117309.1 hypothetical protein [Roseiarcaceae bacterium H3SJ34-1]
MSARSIFDSAPIGAIIRYSDGAPRPPARFTKKLAGWEHRNSGGRLIRKQAERRVGNTTLAATFTLHEGDYGGGGVVVLRVHRTFSVDSALTFVVTEQPAAGAVRVFDRCGDDAQLVHLAGSRADAETWLKSHGYPDAVLDEVTADTHSNESVEGRAVA